MFLNKTAFSIFALGMTIALAEEPPVFVGNLKLENYWVRPSTGGPNTAAYLTITNPSDQPDKLLKADCSHATTVELHNHLNEEGIMKMRPVAFVEVNKGQVVMKPGGLHIMLMGLKDSFKENKTIPITLHFEKAGMMSLNFPVKKIP